MQYFGKEVEFTTKQNDLDFVSFVDIESQKIFTEKLKENFPDDVVMGEEDYEKERDYSQEKNLWIIDPVDGTLLFKKWIPFFWAMIAYVENGEIMYSAILLPAMNELYHADASWSYKNGERISVSKVTKLTWSLINLSHYSFHNFFQTIEQFRKYSEHTGVTIDMYAAAYVMSSCASGRIEWGAFYPNYGNVWDTVPGGFLIQQAGWKVTTMGQNTWDIWNRNTVFSNGNIHEELKKSLSK